MEDLLIALAYGGGIISLIGGLWLLIAAFQQSILWGLAVLFVPLAEFIFIIMHWDRAAWPFIVSLAGFAMSVIAVVIVGPETFETAMLTMRVFV